MHIKYKGQRKLVTLTCISERKLLKYFRFLTELQNIVLTKELRNEVKLQIRMQTKLFALVSSTRRFGRSLPYFGRKFVG
jgi:hypothetical protein